MRVANDTLINQAVASAITSAAFDARHLALVVFQYVITGSAGITTGSLKVQGSVDAATWVDVTSMSATPSGNVGAYFSLTDTPFPWLRVAYTQASGDGTLTVYANGKGF